MGENNTLNEESKRSFIETARRAQIIECAVETIAELGFAQASLAQIAKRANVSTGVILYYFRSKENLIKELLAHIYARFSSFASERVDNTSATASIRSAIGAHVALIATHPKQMRAIANIFYAEASVDGIPRWHHDLVESRRNTFLASLKWGQETGEFRPFDVPSMARAISAAIDDIPRQQILDPNFDLELYGRELVELFDHATRNQARMS